MFHLGTHYVDTFYKNHFFNGFLNFNLLYRGYCCGELRVYTLNRIKYFKIKLAIVDTLSVDTKLLKEIPHDEILSY